MRAFAVRRFGEPASVHDLPAPAADDAVLIWVRFAGVNPLDNNLLGRLTATSSYPFVAGIDFAGVAERVPAGDHSLRAGDRVFGMARTHGAYAEYTAVAPAAQLEPLARIPDGVANDQAAALPIPATTALRTVKLLQVTAGQRVVVMGAAGGVGGYAVQIARSRGAHVIATVRGDAGEALRLGAEEVYDSQATDVIEALRTAHLGGVDAVLDLVSGPDAIRRDAEVIRPGGRLVSTIHAADEGWFAERQITAHNHASSANPLISPDGLTTVAQMLADGTITARIRSTVDLDSAGQVLEELRYGGPARQGRHPPVEPGRTGPGSFQRTRTSGGSLAVAGGVRLGRPEALTARVRGAGHVLSDPAVAPPWLARTGFGGIATKGPVCTVADRGLFPGDGCQASAWSSRPQTVGRKKPYDGQNGCPVHEHWGVRVVVRPPRVCGPSAGDHCAEGQNGHPRLRANDRYSGVA